MNQFIEKKMFFNTFDEMFQFRDRLQKFMQRHIDVQNDKNKKKIR